MTDNQIKQTINNLPHAFDSEYWNLANTTYKEEVFLSIVLSLKIPKEKALKLQSKIFPKNILLRQILKEEVVECMGRYGKGNIGVSFYGSYENVYLEHGKGTKQIK